MSGGTPDMSSNSSGLPRPGSASKSPRSIPSWIFASAMRAKMLNGRTSRPGKLPVHLQLADGPDPKPEPRIGGLVERIALRLESDRRKPQLVGGRIGDAAVQAPPDATVLPLPGRRWGDRVGPLDGVAALVEGPPRRGGARLPHRAHVARIEGRVGRRVDPERVDAGAVAPRLHGRRAPCWRRLA